MLKIMKRKRLINFKNSTVKNSFVDALDTNIINHIIENSWNLLQLRITHINTIIKKVIL